MKNLRLGFPKCRIGFTGYGQTGIRPEERRRAASVLVSQTVSCRFGLRLCSRERSEREVRSATRHIPQKSPGTAWEEFGHVVRPHARRRSYGVARYMSSLYECDLAQRRYMHVDPANRLVADALEAEWKNKLRALNERFKNHTTRNVKPIRSWLMKPNARASQLWRRIFLGYGKVRAHRTASGSVWCG
jgi:hypothetical protein